MEHHRSMSPSKALVSMLSSPACWSFYASLSTNLQHSFSQGEWVRWYVPAGGWKSLPLFIMPFALKPHNRVRSEGYKLFTLRRLLQVLLNQEGSSESKGEKIAFYFSTDDWSSPCIGSVSSYLSCALRQGLRRDKEKIECLLLWYKLSGWYLSLWNHWWQFKDEM